VHVCVSWLVFWRMQTPNWCGVCARVCGTVCRKQCILGWGEGCRLVRMRCFTPVMLGFVFYGCSIDCWVYASVSVLLVNGC